jgi:N utilization substance protein A
MNRAVLSEIDRLVREKGIERVRVIKAIESAMLSAARKKYGGAQNIDVQMDQQTGDIQVVSRKKVVEQVIDPESEIALDDAQKEDESAEIGDEIGFLRETMDLGRIAAQTAKQVILQKVREAEWEVIHREYSGRVGELVSGIILGQERRNYIVQIGKSEARLPKQELPALEVYQRNDRLRAYLLDVRSTPDGPQIILSRTHPQFVARLFEIEVPEIASGTVVIKGLVREAGDRTKVAVASKERGFDPVGACVGVRGCRVQAVVRELRGEKIDIIAWTDDPRTYIGEALSPAVIDRVGVNDEERSALVVVSELQLSLAIGKKGQNVRLASKLTGWRIDLINQVEYEKERAKEREQEIATAIQNEHRKQQESEAGEISEPAPITEATPEAAVGRTELDDPPTSLPPIPSLSEEGSQADEDVPT